MKLISLNTWGGKVFVPLIEFVKRYQDEIDIFCFQEIFSTKTGPKESNSQRMNLYEELETILRLNYQGFFFGVQSGHNDAGDVDFEVDYGLATFIKKGTPIVACEHFFVYGERNWLKPGEWKDAEAGKLQKTVPRNVLVTNFEYNQKKFTVLNLHGLWFYSSKEDNKHRIIQSQKILEFLQKQEGEKILIGDFNLLPHTKSLALLENEMKNLIKEYNITSTRSELYTKENKFADYCLVSKNVLTKDFRVLQETVSDHLPLYLEFE